MDESVVAALQLIAAAGADPLDVAVATEVVIAHFHAVQLVALSAVADEVELGCDPDGVVVDPAASEVGCALYWSPGFASSRVDVARTLRDEVPCVLEALAGGRIDLVKARELAYRPSELTPADRTALVTRGIVYAETHTCAQLRAWLTRAVDRLDAEAAERRRAAARRRRSVWLSNEGDGMATLGAYLTAEEARACLDAIRGHCAGTDGGQAANQADAFVELLTGLSPAQPVPVTVILTEQGAELEGYGPLTDLHAAQLCAGQPLIRLTTPQPSIGYRPGARLARWVRLRDRRCRFPGCRRPASTADLDHTIPWPRGATSEANLHALCRTHHRLKTHTGWRVETLTGHTLQWTSPRGHTYTTYLNDP